MALLDEPKNREGTAHVISTDGNKQQSQIWLNVDDRSKPEFLKTNVDFISLPGSFFALISDSALWLSSAALITKVIHLVNHLITLGYLSQLPTTLALAFVGFPLVGLVLLAYFSFAELRGLLVFRLCLFILGVVLGVS